MRLAFVLVVLASITASRAYAQANATTTPIDTRIAVFVDAPTRDGFVDTNNAIRDSIKDVQNNVRNKRGLIVVNELPSSDVVLRVMGRGVVSRQRGEVALPFLNGVAIAPIYANKKVVRVVLEAGEFRKDFVEFEDGYGDCAERIAKQVHAWVDANRDTLLQRRSTSRE